MRKILTYSIGELMEYINWPYFFHAWGLNGNSDHEQERMRTEAEAVLHDYDGKYRVYALFSLCDANGDGDDIVICGGLRIPMLRQQHPSEDGCPMLCLADYLRPLDSGIPDRLGLFATSVDAAMESDSRDDVYRHMMCQTLADRLAEAAAERLHYEVRTRYWGYASGEECCIHRMLVGDYQGIRPAIGYPSLPDVSINFILSDQLGMKDIGIRLTESGMMTPHASVSGFMFAHPAARYFDLGKIGEDQLHDYARRRSVPVSLMRRFLESSLTRQ